MAGLIEGEACFQISKQARNTNHRCAMTVAMRDDEEPLLRRQADETRLGRITRRAAAGNSRPQVCWQINAKADCQRLCDLLYAYPLRGRQSVHFAIWSAAVHSWIDGAPTRTRRGRDWTAVAYFKRRLQDAKQYTSGMDDLSLSDRHAGLAGDWSGYFAGFVTAEGHFGLHRNGRMLAPKFQLALRADNLALLTALRTRCGGLGRVYHAQSRRGSSPSVAWQVRDRGGLLALTEIFDITPPLGRRGQEYEVWRRAVRAYASSMPRALIRERLLELRPKLLDIRNGTSCHPAERSPAA